MQLSLITVELQPVRKSPLGQLLSLMYCLTVIIKSSQCPMMLCPIILIAFQHHILLDEKPRGLNSSKRLFLGSLGDERDCVRSWKWDLAASILGLSYIVLQLG